MTTSTIKILASDAKTLGPPRGRPLLRLGFRPFYLGAATVACIEVPLWVAAWLGWLQLPTTLPSIFWHAHEMLFGFAAAVLAGFLLTSGKAWTGLATLRGASLGALVLLWAAARLTSFGGPYALHAALDLALLPVVAVVLGSVLLRSGNHRNLVLVAMLTLLAVANGVFHLAVLGVISLSPLAPLHAAVALIVLIECVIAGRIVPGFTMSATPGLRIKARTPLDAATIGG